jgi:hypothetical protein
MKLGGIATVLSAYSRAVGRAGDKNSAAIAAEFAKALDAKKELAIKDFLKFVPRPPAEEQVRSDEITAGVAASVLEGLIELAEVMGSKELNKDLVKLSKFLQGYSLVPISLFGPKVASASRQRRTKGTASVDRALVEKYLTQLEASLGKDEFVKLYDDLRNDAEVTKLEAVEIADRFMGPVAPSTSRAKALQRVLYRHRKLMDFSSGSESIGGRAA